MPCFALDTPVRMADGRVAGVRGQVGDRVLGARARRWLSGRTIRGRDAMFAGGRASGMRARPRRLLVRGGRC